MKDLNLKKGGSSPLSARHDEGAADMPIGREDGRRTTGERD